MLLFIWICKYTNYNSFIFNSISYFFKEPNLFCTLKYTKLYYFDKFYSIFKNINFIQMMALALYSLCVRVYHLFVNITIGKYTICHLFMPMQLAQFIFNINDILYFYFQNGIL